MIVSAGWTVEYDGSRSACLEFIERHWTDMRLRSLVLGETPVVER